LKGIDAFTLEFQVQFPMSLILNKKILTKYQFLFRHLFHCKYLERILMGTWLDHAKLRKAFKGGVQSANSSYAPWQDEVSFIARLGALSAKMLHFIQQFMYYMFIEVIEPNWAKMEKNMLNVN
jgi:gamma-tubulin complex component 2